MFFKSPIGDGNVTCTVYELVTADLVHVVQTCSF